MSFARIQAYLGLNISGFQSGLSKANAAGKKFKAEMGQGGAAGLFKGGIGAGALVAGFKAVIARAQEARDAAAKIGRTVDDGTASVARYGDAWDRIKATIGDIAVVGLSFLTRTGEAAGNVINDNMDRARAAMGGQSVAESQRIRGIDVSAEENARRLSTPEAKEAAFRRGEERKKAADRAEADRMKTVVGLMTEGSERRAQADLEALPIAQQIARLETKRVSLQKTFADSSRSALTRAKAFSDLTKTEDALQGKIVEDEKQKTEQKKKQTAEAKKHAKEVEKAQKSVKEAQKDETKAANGLATARSDALGFTVGDAASGARGSLSARNSARGIQRDEATALRLHDSGNKVSLFDSATQRNKSVGSEFFQQRALDARSSLGGLTSGEQNPFAAAQEELKSAGVELKAAAEALKTAVITIEVED